MIPTPIPVSTNPLVSFMRQPKIYIRLPSNGKFWPDGSLLITENEEYPVYSMTAKDELMLKVPDAVMSGQAVVDVIQHCVPNIKNAWNTPSIDLDIILIAIRLATYGEKMVTPVSLNDDFTLDHTIDLRQVMDTLLNQLNWEEHVPINENLTVYVRPLTYKQISQSAVKTFETQKILQLVNNDDITEADKISAFKDSFKKLTEVTIGIIEQSIYKIDSSEGSTSNRDHIKEFIENLDKEEFDKIQNHLDKLKEQNTLKPSVINVTDELREHGVTGDTIEIPLVFDHSTFFV